MSEKEHKRNLKLWNIVELAMFMTPWNKTKSLVSESDS